MLFKKFKTAAKINLAKNALSLSGSEEARQ